MTNIEVCPGPGQLVDDECPSNPKTAISGAYHNFNFSKYADRYLAEVGGQSRIPLDYVRCGHRRMS